MRVRAGCMLRPSRPNAARVLPRWIVVPKKKPKAATAEGRPLRRKLSAEESLQRMREFDKRKGAFIVALRKSKDRGVSP